MNLVILGLLVTAMILRRVGKTLIAAILNGVLALLLLFYYIIPGSAGIFHWILLVACALQSGLYFYQQRSTQ